MTIVRQTEWLDGEDFAHLQDLLDIVMQDALADEHRCVFCRAEQPHDVKWPAYAFELEHKETGDQSGDVEFRACHRCEPRLDRLLFELGAK